jgi:hypothetical protein
MRDDPCSAYVRAKRGLPDNWRVYQLEAVENFTKVRLIGSLVRPASPEFEPHLRRDFDWIKPITGKAQLTITQAEYNAIYEKGEPK